MKDITDSYHLASFYIEHIPGRIYSGIKSNMKRYDHSPRLGYLTPEKKYVIFSITHKPRILAKSHKSIKIEPDIIYKIKRFIITNKTVLLRHWYDGDNNFSTLQMFNQLKWNIH